MKVLLRTVAIWTALQGLLVLAFGLSHWGAISPSGKPFSMRAAFLVAILVLAGLFALWAGIELWGLGRRGRLLATGYYTVSGASLVLAALSSGQVTTYVVPLLLTAAIIGVLLIAGARKVVQRSA